MWLNIDAILRGSIASNPSVMFHVANDANSFVLKGGWGRANDTTSFVIIEL